MATATITMPNSFISKIESFESNADDVAEKVLKAGGEIMYSKVKTNLQSVLSGNSTGQLLSSLGLTDVKKDSNGNSNIKIGFSESRTDGETNAKIATILEYGSVKQTARPFLKPAKTEGQTACKNAMISVLEKEFE